MRQQQNGNALFIILIAVALFAALSYAITQSSRGGGNTISKEQNMLDLARITDIGAQMSQGILRMKVINGCKDTEISFEDNNGSSKKNDGTPFDYTNASTPSDGSCKVFDKNGGQAAIPSPIPDSLVVSPSGVCSGCVSPTSWYASDMQIEGIGTSASDLVLWVGRLTKEQCIAINDHFGVTNPGGNPPQDNFNGCNPPFQGTYNTCTDVVGDDAPELDGKSDFCFDWGGGAMGDLYIHVLLAR